jgi:putative ABC transport system permease protein
VSNLPLGGNFDKYGFHIEEKPLENPEEAPSVERYVISNDYLRTMEIPLLAGREFTDRDGPDAPFVVMISESTAHAIWPNEDPIGKQVRMGAPQGPLRTIVGITRNVNHYGLDTTPDLQAYVPEAQWTGSDMTLLIRSTLETKSLLDSVRDQIWAVDKDLPIYRVAKMEELVSESVAQRRFIVVLLTVLAGLAGVLAAFGIYSVTSYSVTQRTQEFGVRMALGAQATDVLKLVLAQGALLALVGIGIGFAASFALTRVMSSLLFGIGPTDFLTFVLVALIVAVVSLVACLVPARRATRVDPMTALRYE